MHIRWTGPAVRDLTHIFEYIEKHGSRSAARRVAISIHQAVDMLARFPEHGRTGRHQDTRELVFNGLPYLAVYRARENSVEILRILHGAQEWPK